MRSRDRAENFTSRAARVVAILLTSTAAWLVGATASPARADGEVHTCGCPCAAAEVRTCAEPGAATTTAAAATDGESDDDVITPTTVGDSRLPLLPTTRGELRELQAALDQQRWGVALDTVGVLTCALGTAFFIPLDNNHRVGDFSSGAMLAGILIAGGVSTIILGAVTYSRGSDREAAVTARVAARLVARPVASR